MKLQDEDYIFLYLWATPKQISEEFGKIAHSERQIYRIFKKLKLQSTRKARKELYLRCSEELGKLNHFETILKDTREKAFSETWERLERINKCYT